MDEIYRYYEILDLQPGASTEEVKQAYRELVKVWHPDRFSHDPKILNRANEKLKEINEAYTRLQSFQSDFGNSHKSWEDYTQKTRTETVNNGYNDIQEPQEQPTPIEVPKRTGPTSFIIRWILIGIVSIIVSSGFAILIKSIIVTKINPLINVQSALKSLEKKLSSPSANIHKHKELSPQTNNNSSATEPSSVYLHHSKTLATRKQPLMITPDSQEKPK